MCQFLCVFRNYSQFVLLLVFCVFCVRIFCWLLCVYLSSTSAIDFVERLVSKMTGEMLNSPRSCQDLFELLLLVLCVHRNCS